MTDIINVLAGIAAEDPLDSLRDHRAEAKVNAQRSFDALLEPEDPGAFSHRDRYIVAAFTAGLLGAESAEVFYRDLLRDEDETASFAVAQLLDEALAAPFPGASVPDDGAAGVRGPYGVYESTALAAESVPGPWLSVGRSGTEALGPFIAAGLEFTHLLVLHPRDSRPEHLARLLAAGWEEDSIVTLAQLVSFLNFQIRVAVGLGALADPRVPGDLGTTVRTGAEAIAAAADDASPTGAPSASPHSTGATSVGAPATGGADALRQVGERVLTYPRLRRPTSFQQSGLGWVPWITPLAEADLTALQHDALVEAGRAKNPYFRLLARDPAALRARTLTDFDIFFNTTDGLGRAERELAAAAASRFNGCLFCASVHSHRATEESGQHDTVQRLLDQGAHGSAPAGEAGAEASRGRLGDPVWDAVVEASVALSRTPQSFGPAQVRALREAGLADGDIIDVLNCAAFFNWANRLMLALGEPELIAPGK